MWQAGLLVLTPVSLSCLCSEYWWGMRCLTFQVRPLAQLPARLFTPESLCPAGSLFSSSQLGMRLFGVTWPLHKTKSSGLSWFMTIAVLEGLPCSLAESLTACRLAESLWVAGKCWLDAIPKAFLMGLPSLPARMWHLCLSHWQALRLLHHKRQFCHWGSLRDY